MEDKLKLVVDYFGRDRVKLKESISNHTATGLGGRVGLFFIAFSTSEIVKMVEFARELKLPFLIFGTGTKMVIPDKGFEGIVVKNRTSNVRIVAVKGKIAQKAMGVDEAYLEVDAGLSINKLTEFASNQGLETGEISGLPGTVGGNLFLQRSLQTKAQSIKVMAEGEIEEIKGEDLKLKKHIILSAVLRFKSKI